MTNVRFEDWEAEQMKNPEFREAYEFQELAYQVALAWQRYGFPQDRMLRARRKVGFWIMRFGMWIGAWA